MKRRLPDELPLEFGVGASLQSRLDGVDWDFPSYLPLPAVKRIHALHWYPAPFPAALVGTLLDIVSPTPGAFLDPFCGTGVAPVEAWLRGFTSTGIDLNRFAIRVADAKSTVLLSADDEAARSLVASYQEYRVRVTPSWLGAGMGALCDWAGIDEGADRFFATRALREIAVAKRWLAEAVPMDWTSVVWVLLSSILHRVSELREVHYTYVVDRSKTTRKPTSTVDVPLSLTRKISDVFRDAMIFREEMATAGMPLNPSTQPRYVKADAQTEVQHLAGPYDVAITSPPYFGMNDYVRSQYLTWLIDPWEGFDNDVFGELGARRDRWSRGKAQAYVDGVGAVISGLSRKLRTGAPLVLVLGQSHSAIAQEYNPVAAVKAAVKESGFDLLWERERRVQFRKINNTPYRAEVVCVFRKH
ncbi:MAG TPA: hypothetical protein VK988_19705 [Acidimicrobiales bacterium]|nr:hypothetical protein [Acidimicrobiales bacterium]